MQTSEAPESFSRRDMPYASLIVTSLDRNDVFR